MYGYETTAAYQCIHTCRVLNQTPFMWAITPKASNICTCKCLAQQDWSVAIPLWYGHLYVWEATCWLHQWYGRNESFVIMWVWIMIFNILYMIYLHYSVTCSTFAIIITSVTVPSFQWSVNSFETKWLLHGILDTYYKHGFHLFVYICIYKLPGFSNFLEHKFPVYQKQFTTLIACIFRSKGSKW